MNLDETQKTKVAAWIAEGLKLSEIQNRITAELGIRATYMDVRLLVDDLKLTPKDIEPPKVVTSGLASPEAGAAAQAAGPSAPAGAKPAGVPPGATGPVSLTVDQIARPNAVVSGKVTFTDGNRADWYFDQSGRLGLLPQQEGYRPSPIDLQQFQIALESELSKLGM